MAAGRRCPPPVGHQGRAGCLLDFGRGLRPAEEQREIQALAREVADTEIAPNASEWDKEHRFPRAVFTKLGELGLMGVCVPEELGGAGADFVSYVLVLEELSPGRRRRGGHRGCSHERRDPAADRLVRHRGAESPVRASARAR